MGASTTFLIRPRAAMLLGRVSNLPTIFSNAMAGFALAGGDFARTEDLAALAAAALALLLFYVGGMYLNDAFDAAVDARERPMRPIPRGDASRGAVFVAGSALLLAAMWIAARNGAGPEGLALATAILLYDMLHKRTAFAPLIMGLCRLLCYVLAARIAGAVPGPALLFGAFGLFCHVVGLTYAARQEAHDRLGSAWPLAVLALPLGWAFWSAWGDGTALILWLCLLAATALGLSRLMRRAAGDVPRAVALLIAAISLFDAVLIAATGATAAAIVAALCYPATLLLQRLVPGT
ncbi:hypothetical protein CLG96_02545 [Sphingomonas oleivorans]|uniref:Prenyltransferase n=1 Tax=Sphingomonas oleivorans TaxID=1735121 RepID=A0A2T5G1N6_9SPHN|nr:UbiA family prenyltransferase [Sphingomonas oleivorans]PTQ13038.1 hypothetical protein CLG96_02545 [Sphingomonas oleivorans]